MDAVPYDAGDPRSVYLERLREARVSVKEVHRVFPPADTNGEVEVLYLDKDGRPCTAYFVDDETQDADPVICTGW